MYITNIYWGDRGASRLQMHASFSAVILLVGVARWKENSTGIKLLTTVCGLWILLGNCVMLSLFMWVPSSFIIYERKAQIPKTQQLTPEQSRWTNNTTGESGEYVPLFWGWTVPLRCCIFKSNNQNKQLNTFCSPVVNVTPYRWHQPAWS